MINLVTQTLQILVGLPLWSIGRAGTLVWFAFGSEYRDIPLKNGGHKTVSDYALHVQCSWRIRQGNRILVASSDRFYPSGDDPYLNMVDFEWDKEGANQLDQRVTKFMEEKSSVSLIVDQVNGDETGSFCLRLNEEYYLEVFPDNSIITEHWRLFRPYSEQEHFLFTNEGIKRE